MLRQGLIDKIDFNGPGGCWLWTGWCNPRGYGYSDWMTLAHREVYQALVGPIPEGMDLDHLCFVKNCCNPVHLEPVPHRVNIKRSGHVYSAALKLAYAEGRKPRPCHGAHGQFTRCC